uniref:P-type ATPase N-terminal domain-containing protein n=1 Tax=Sinocyclocheilus anshuiensis TaxID=1608454 RepID=A0A671PNN3_9TELE
LLCSFVFSLLCKNVTGSVSKTMLQYFLEGIYLAKNRRVVMPSWTEHEEIKELQQSYSRNKVRTTKYTFISFIPKNLFEQLHRFANVYFVFLGALNFVPIVNAFQPEISIIPIVFVMSITAVKDLWEDQRRKKSDQQVNNRLCDIYDR